MKTPKYILAALGSLLAVFSLSTVKAAGIVAWDAKPGNTTLSSATASTLDPYLAGPVTLNLGSGFSASSVGGNTFGGYATVDTSSGLASANSAGTYWSFTLTPAAGYQVEVDSLVVPATTENESNTHGLFIWQNNAPCTINLASSLDSYGSSLSSTTPTNSGGGGAGYWTLNLNTPFITTSAVTFRIAISENFGWKVVGLQNDDYYEPALRKNALTVNGALTSVPEPATYAMLLGGVGMLALFRRRRD